MAQIVAASYPKLFEMLNAVNSEEIPIPHESYEYAF
jgi:hypothetical protein|tara:strand:+ start:843 stop:950 length:108 start_codon:yes stop_codon:yes gene_type:complete